MLIYVTTFFTLSPIGVKIVALSLMEFLSGGIIPIPFLPYGIRGVVELLPLASMQNMHFRIYSGNIQGIDALYGVIIKRIDSAPYIFTLIYYYGNMDIEIAL